MSDEELGEVIIGGVFLVGVILGIFGSFILDRKLHVRQPNARPFKWGYFNGIVAAVWLPFSLMAFYGSTTDNEYLASFVLMVIGILGVLVIKRSRVAFLFLTILSLNPIGWIINGIYLNRRWQELAAVPTGKDSRLASEPQAPARNTFTDYPRESSAAASLRADSGSVHRSQPSSYPSSPAVPPPTVVSATVNKPKVSAPPPEIYVATNGQKEGPFTVAEILERLRTSANHRTQLYWQPGMDDWRPLRELADKLQRTGTLS
jgi:GYF domain 2